MQSVSDNTYVLYEARCKIFNNLQLLNELLDINTIKNVVEFNTLKYKINTIYNRLQECAVSLNLYITQADKTTLKMALENIKIHIDNMNVIMQRLKELLVILTKFNKNENDLQIRLMSLDSLFSDIRKRINNTNTYLVEKINTVQKKYKHRPLINKSVTCHLLSLLHLLAEINPIHFNIYMNHLLDYIKYINDDANSLEIIREQVLERMKKTQLGANTLQADPSDDIGILRELGYIKEPFIRMIGVSTLLIKNTEDALVKGIDFNPKQGIDNKYLLINLVRNESGQRSYIPIKIMNYIGKYKLRALIINTSNNNVGYGHYIAMILGNDGWVMYDDNNDPVNIGQSLQPTIQSIHGIPIKIEENVTMALYEA